MTRFRAKISDGHSVKVVASKEYTHADFVLDGGFHGFAFADAKEGEPVTLNIENAEYEFAFIGGANVGDVIYSTPQGVLTLSAEGNRPVMRVSMGASGEDVVWAILFDQSGTVGGGQGGEAERLALSERVSALEV